jgi:hypothetical protein
LTKSVAEAVAEEVDADGDVTFDDIPPPAIPGPSKPRLSSAPKTVVPESEPVIVEDAHMDAEDEQPVLSVSMPTRVEAEAWTRAQPPCQMTDLTWADVSFDRLAVKSQEKDRDDRL